ncbi:MAG: GYD domain-containing protein [Dehalococcoidia bacterium]|nr:GYD domain-containing protein [Dehalococcoidia bacterium]MDD5494941.1 GYD domain-containing protein [Dehalococcoidia bacterium]
MATYIMFVGFTQKGITEVKKLPVKTKTGAHVLKKAGVKVQGFYLVMGMDRYDGFYIVQAADAEKVAAAALALGSQGDMHTNTLRAFSETEFRDMV